MFQPFIPFLHGILPSCVGPCFLTILRKQLVLPFDLIFFLRSSMVAILCCYFISSSSVCSSCLLCRHWRKVSPSNPLFTFLFRISCFCALFSIGLPLPLKAPFLLSSTLYLSRIHLTLVQCSPSFHLFRIFHHLAFTGPSSLSPLRRAT